VRLRAADKERETNRKEELRGKKRGPAAKNGGHQPKRNRKNQQRGGAAAHCVPLLPHSRLALSLLNLICSVPASAH
jgi:hypothetical protein